jgi:hypothetical protein
MSDVLAAKYQVQRKREGIRDSFMQVSRQISNAVIINKQIFSDKFHFIMQAIK